MAQLARTPTTRSAAEPLAADDDEGDLAAPTEPAKLGRYVLLGEIGSGGMGVVHDAYDPDLRRKVAIKLVRTNRTGKTARARILREAQALAQLAHPNVIAIYDVGVVDDDVYIAMELVVGDTIARWLSRRARSWKEVLAVYVAAGEGLAAAHEKGLIHRDFKPQNVMVDDVGRVRVLDFGLVRLADQPSEDGLAAATLPDARLGDSALGSTITRGDGLVGTPAYMAPEQFRRADVDARTDQFSFCVALWEGLYGVPPFGGATVASLTSAVVMGGIQPPPASKVPSWLHRVLVRGLARNPTDRFASMRELLATIERGSARRRRRPLWLLAGTVALAGAVGLGASSLEHTRAVAACESTGEELDAAWTLEIRARLEQTLRESGDTYTAITAASALSRIDAWVDDWATLRRQSCLDALDGKVSPEIASRSEACFEELEASFDVFVDGLADKAVAFESAVTWSVRLPRPEDCVDERRLSLQPASNAHPEIVRELRKQLARARGLNFTGRFATAVEAAKRVHVRAEQFGLHALSAEANNLLVACYVHQGRWEQAEAAALEAYMTGTKFDAVEAAAEAATQLVVVIGHHRDKPEVGLAWAQAAAATIAMLESEPGLMTATLLRKSGVVQTKLGNYDEAQGELAQALAIEERLRGPDAPSLSLILVPLAEALRPTDPAAAVAAQERACAIDLRVLGPRHPKYAECLSNLVSMQRAAGRSVDAIATLEWAHTLFVEALGPEYHKTVRILGQLALAYLDVGSLEQAASLFEQQIEIDEDTGDAVYNLARTRHMQGRLDDALALYERSISLREVAKYESPDLCPIRAYFGLLWVERGDLAAAWEVLARARDECEQHQGADSPEMGVVISGLGDVHRLTHDPVEARAMYERAITLMRTRSEPAWNMPKSFPLMGLAKLELELGHPGMAIRVAEQALALRSSDQPPLAPIRHQAESRFVLAQALWDAPPDAGRDREHAVALADAALAMLAGESDYEGEREALRAWLHEHPL